MKQQNPGRLVIISGPSGAGKSTVVQKLLTDCQLPLQLSVSATTRPARPDEVDGKDYQFISKDEFDRLKSEDKFLECKEVFGRGHWYGTLREQVVSSLNEGKWVILEIDVQGAIAVLRRNEFDPITLFIHPGGMDELERRLRNRGTETEEAIKRRLEIANDEMQYQHRYQHEIINGTVETAVAEICKILCDQKENHPCSKT